MARSDFSSCPFKSTQLICSLLTIEDRAIASKYPERTKKMQRLKKHILPYALVVLSTCVLALALCGCGPNKIPLQQEVTMETEWALWLTTTLKRTGQHMTRSPALIGIARSPTMKTPLIPKTVLFSSCSPILIRINTKANQRLF